MQSNFELLRRIDEKDYITEREHREFINELKKALEELEWYKKLFNEPIQTLIKDLEILELIKIYTQPKLLLHFGFLYLVFKQNNTIISYSLPAEKYDIIKEWLENGN